MMNGLLGLAWRAGRLRADTTRLSTLLDTAITAVTDGLNTSKP